VQYICQKAEDLAYAMRARAAPSDPSRLRTASGGHAVSQSTPLVEELRWSHTIHEIWNKRADPSAKSGTRYPPLEQADVHPDSFSAWRNRYRRSHGLSLRVHDFRHSHATWGLQEGISPKVMSERLGHSDIAITLGPYSHVTEAMQQPVVDFLDERFAEQ
jgi:integrase